MQKNCPPAGIEPTAFGLPGLQQWTGNPKAADSITAGGQFFRIAWFKAVAVLVTFP